LFLNTSLLLDIVPRALLTNSVIFVAQGENTSNRQIIFLPASAHLDPSQITIAETEAYPLALPAKHLQQ
jgi:hypothetical protein